MLTVGIKNFELWAFVGLYPEEKKVPNKLIFNVSVQLKESNAPFLDYTLLIALIKNKCATPTDLLEELLQQILNELKIIAPSSHIHISIEKCNPPTGDCIQSSFVVWQE